MTFPVTSSSLYASFCMDSVMRNGPSQFGESFPSELSFPASPWSLQTKLLGLKLHFLSFELYFQVILCLHPSSSRRVKLITEFEMDRYSNNSALDVSRVKMGRVVRKILNSENIALHYWSQWKLVGCFSSWKNDFAFSAILFRNRDRSANLLVNLCISFKLCGLHMAMRSSHLFGLPSIPIQVIMKPRNLPLSTPKTHFSGLNRMLCF